MEWLMVALLLSLLCNAYFIGYIIKWRSYYWKMVGHFNSLKQAFNSLKDSFNSLKEANDVNEKNVEVLLETVQKQNLIIKELSRAAPTIH